jgi:hypothetical protein
MNPTKIDKLTSFNVQALREQCTASLNDGDLVLTTSTATWTRSTPEQVLHRLNEIMVRLPSRGHPRASLHAVCRKLHALTMAPEPEEAPEVNDEPEDVPEQDDDGRPVEILVEEKLQQEIAEATIRLRRLDDMLFDAKGEYDKAADRAEKTHKPEDIRKAENLHQRVVSLADQGTAQSQKLRILKTDEERERRVQSKSITNERIKKMTATKTTKETAKDQGFPAKYLGSNGNFKPGFDARAKSDLINAILGLPNGNALVKFSVEDAEKLIAVRGWESFVEKKRKIEAEKTAKAEAAKEAKAQAAKDKADAKAAKAEEDDGEEEKPQVKPDPKPSTGSRKRSSGRGRKSASAAK